MSSFSNAHLDHSPVLVIIRHMQWLLLPQCAKIPMDRCLDSPRSMLAFFRNVPFGLYFLSFAPTTGVLSILSSSLPTVFSFDSFMDLIQRLLSPRQNYTGFDRLLEDQVLNRHLRKVLKKLLWGLKPIRHPWSRYSDLFFCLPYSD